MVGGAGGAGGFTGSGGTSSGGGFSGSGGRSGAGGKPGVTNVSGGAATVIDESTAVINRPDFVSKGSGRAD
jgi:hypothetical protein